MNEKYITCNYQGMLGNLMFEIAATLSAAWDNNAIPTFPKHYHNYYESLPAFSAYILPIVSQFHQHGHQMDFKPFKENSDFSYKPIIINENTKIYGYFTTSLYFDRYRNKIIDIFSTNQKEVLGIYDLIRKEYPNRELVTIHVRRTDYVTDYGDELPIEYYMEAIKHFDNPLYIIFSDDKKWCAENLTFINDKIFIDQKDYIELLLMGKFDAHICANSTFSTMGIILGDRHKTKKVIAPKVWVNKTYNKDIQEKHWTLI